MASSSNIEWTDSSWTPIRARNLKTGKIGWHCEHATTGCEFCYAEGMNKRLGTGLAFKPGHRKDIEIFLDEKMLLAPLRWKKPRMIFVCSMTDAFAEFVKDEWLDKMFAIMALCPQHTFQVLTKRAERMRAYLLEPTRHNSIELAAETVRRGPEQFGGKHVLPRLPLPNVWIGISAERQQEADERIPHLLQTPAAIRFVSLEPLLGPIDLTRVRGGTLDALIGHDFEDIGDIRDAGDLSKTNHPPGLNWIIVGGESGPNARRMKERWARDIRDDCANAGVPFFFKQWGQHDPNTWERVGKKAAGRLLDGKEHNEMPTGASP